LTGKGVACGKAGVLTEDSEGQRCNLARKLASHLLMRTSEDRSQGCISYKMSDPTLKEQATKTFLNAKKLPGNIAERVQ
jgi:hypothetical protein